MSVSTCEAPVDGDYKRLLQTETDERILGRATTPSVMQTKEQDILSDPPNNLSFPTRPWTHSRATRQFLGVTMSCTNVHTEILPASRTSKYTLVHPHYHPPAGIPAVQGFTTSHNPGTLLPHHNHVSPDPAPLSRAQNPIAVDPVGCLPLASVDRWV
jgi:hypothetical protein